MKGILLVFYPGYSLFVIDVFVCYHNAWVFKAYQFKAFDCPNLYLKQVLCIAFNSFSFPGLYWSYLDKLFPLDENGEMLIKVIQSSQIIISGNSPENQAICYRKPRPRRGEQKKCNSNKN